MANPQKENGYTALSNEIVEKLAKYRISGEEWQILLVVLRKTYGWQKTEDCISLSQFVDMTGLKRSNVVRSIHKLVSKKILGSINNDTTYITKYWFIKDYDNWITSIKKDTSINKDTTPSINNDTKTSINNDTHKRNKQTIQKKDSDKSSTKEFIDWWYLQYKETFNCPYHVNGGKDVMIIKNLINTFGIDELKKRALIFLISEDSFIKKAGYTIGVFSSQINKVTKESVNGTKKWNDLN